jgi:transcriptional regulator with PAS, ATPase and Fis domain
MQAKLLTVIEKKEVIKVGSTKPVPIDIRLICATNNNIHDMVAEESFRQDLLYRINTVEIHLPPLRERTGDIPILADHFLKIYNKKYKKNVSRISNEAINKLNQYHWPGNVRELQHAIERALIMSDSGQLTAEDFVLSSPVRKSDELELQTYNLDEIEKNVIIKVMKQNQGNISQAASELGLTRTSLYRRMEKYGL